MVVMMPKEINERRGWLRIADGCVHDCAQDRDFLLWTVGGGVKLKWLDRMTYIPILRCQCMIHRIVALHWSVGPGYSNVIMLLLLNVNVAG